MKSPRNFNSWDFDSLSAGINIPGCGKKATEKSRYVFFCYADEKDSYPEWDTRRAVSSIIARARSKKMCIFMGIEEV